jgi:phytol kinase
MIDAIIATGIIFVLMVLAEILFRRRMLRGEYSRKFLHILSGVFAAFLPFWIGYGWVTLLAALALVSGLVNKKFKIFKSGSDIKRRTYGDLLFGISILVLSLVKPNKWIYAGAILQVALADGFAAIIGTKYGKRRYKIFGNTKSLVGTLTFSVVSLATTIMVVHFGGGDVNASKLAAIAAVSLVLAGVENIGVYGTDNLMLPLGFLILLKI